MIILDYFPAIYKFETLVIWKRKDWTAINFWPEVNRMLQWGELASDIYRPRLRGVTVPYPGNRAGRFSNNFVDLRNTKKGFYLFPGYGYGLAPPPPPPPPINCWSCRFVICTPALVLVANVTLTFICHIVHTGSARNIWNKNISECLNVTNTIFLSRNLEAKLFCIYIQAMKEI